MHRSSVKLGAPADRPRGQGLASVGAAIACGRLGEKRKVKLMTGRSTPGTERADKELRSKSLVGQDGDQLARSPRSPWSPWSHRTAKGLLLDSLPSATRTGGITPEIGPR